MPATGPESSSLAIEHVDPSTLAPAPYNPRKMDAEARKRLERGIREFGLVDPIIARRSDRMVIGGHQRLTSALALGLMSVPVVYLDDISDDRAAALNILLNNQAAAGDFDLPKLTDILSELDAHGFDATLTGFDIDALADMLGHVPEVPFGALPDGDKTPFRQMTFTLHDSQAEQVDRALSVAKAMGAFVDSPNENSNGNALARVCETFLTAHGGDNA